MGIYLNSKKPFGLYNSEAAKPYFVDKSLLIQELIPLVKAGNNCVCITRPRRFGKTVMANMIASYFSRGKNSEELFSKLKISKTPEFKEHINHYDLIYISFNEIPRECTSYQQYIYRIQEILLADLKREYPDCGIDDNEAVWDALNKIYELQDEVRFIFIFDEWDYIFHRDFISEADKKEFISFLSTLLKDKPYVSLAYMTGILPIAKYSSGSELNMFLEYTMSTQAKYGKYFGFTETEVDALYQRYQQSTPKPHITRHELQIWYDGYHTVNDERLYNPRSVVAALDNDRIGSYWTSSGPYDEIFYCIKNNIADVKNDIALMVAGESVVANVQEYAATATVLETRDEILSAMIVYGFLTCEDGWVSIPNKELMDKFDDMVKKERSLGYVYRLAKESSRMLRATLNGDTKTMEDILKQAHDTETDMKGYNDERELSAVIKLAYLAARDKYNIQREEKAGVGYVDYIFYPVIDKNDDCIIIELKINHTADEAIQQIKSRNYAQRFIGKLGENPYYTGRILAVGISYMKNTAEKKHECKVEILRNKI